MHKHVSQSPVFSVHQQKKKLIKLRVGLSLEHFWLKFVVVQHETNALTS
jgi:hypothetical protein